MRVTQAITVWFLIYYASFIPVHGMIFKPTILSNFGVICETLTRILCMFFYSYFAWSFCLSYVFHLFFQNISIYLFCLEFPWLSISLCAIVWIGQGKVARISLQQVSNSVATLTLKQVISRLHVSEWCLYVRTEHSRRLKELSTNPWAWSHKPSNPSSEPKWTSSPLACCPSLCKNTWQRFTKNTKSVAFVANHSTTHWQVSRFMLIDQVFILTMVVSSWVT